MANRGNRIVDFYQEVMEGRWSHYYSETPFGVNRDIDTSGEDIWNGGGIYTGQPVGFTPETVDVFSSSANDTSAGTGARAIRFFGLRTSLSAKYETQDVVLNGTTPVVTTSTWWRINKAVVLTAGSTGNNVGDITIRSTTTTANVFAVIPATFNLSHVGGGAWTVPASTIAVAKRVRIAMARANNAAGTATITARVRSPGGVYVAARFWELTTSVPISYTALGGVLVTAGTDIKIRADAVSNAGSIVEAAVELLVKKL